MEFSCHFIPGAGISEKPQRTTSSKYREKGTIYMYVRRKKDDWSFSFVYVLWLRGSCESGQFSAVWLMPLFTSTRKLLEAQRSMWLLCKCFKSYLSELECDSTEDILQETRDSAQTVKIAQCTEGSLANLRGSWRKNTIFCAAEDCVTKDTLGFFILDWDCTTFALAYPILSSRF